jgi:hypothetical protein
VGVRDAGRADPGKTNAPLALWGSLPPSQANGAIWPGRPVADTTPRQGVARLRRRTGERLRLGGLANSGPRGSSAPPRTPRRCSPECARAH